MWFSKFWGVRGLEYFLEFQGVTPPWKFQALQVVITQAYPSAGWVGNKEGPPFSSFQLAVQSSPAWRNRGQAPVVFSDS